jgi:hypothetical protein
MFGHVGRGWDSDFIDLLEVRLQDQTFQPPIPLSAKGWEALPSFIQDVLSNGKDGRPKIPLELQTGVRALLLEFCQLRSSNPITSATAPCVIPWFHDEVGRFPGQPVTDETRGRDRWQSTQPWRPIFIEWEAIYYDIPFDKWNFKEYNSRWHWGAKVVHYGIDDNLAAIQATLAQRNISGRQYLLPQASSTLTTILGNIFQNTNSDDLKNKYHLPDDEQTRLLNIVADLDIISGPMTGLTSNLLTLYEGSHVKPLVRLPNQPVVPIDAAVTALPYSAAEKAFATALVTKMNTETTLTPYGSSDILDGTNTTNGSPMKPVTHGQLMFTKINIVDKFGQVISAIDPSPPAFNKPIPSITPCISDSYFPGTLDGINPDDDKARANTVVTPSDNQACTSIALTPSINQPARLNAAFVTKTDGAWTQCSEWDDPIWGWIVINYADNGLQLFLPDGTFYREVRVGGQAKESTSKKFLPFDPPATIADEDWKVAQLDQLIQKLATPGDESYLQGFFDMISQSIDDKQAHAPASYATFSSAIIGKPLALVNAGWSLELAGSQNINWSTSVPTKPARQLLKETTNDFPSTDNDPNGASFPVGDERGYTFPVKLGDSQRSFDGLVGYFPLSQASSKQVSAPTTAGTVSSPLSDLDLTKLYTYFTDSLNTDQTATKLVPAVPTQDPRIALTLKPGDKGSILTPLRLTPYHFSSTIVGNPSAKLTIFGLIVDPFFPVHAYSAILPNQSLKLPDWTVEQALMKMTAFWQAGPLLSVQDVPRVLEQKDELTADYVSTIAPTDDNDPTKAQQVTVAIPLAAPAASSSGAGAEYMWLQPYWKQVNGTISPASGGISQPPSSMASAGAAPPAPAAVFDTRYRAFAISGDAASGADAATMRLEAAPYTAIEGYVQIAKPLTG